MGHVKRYFGDWNRIAPYATGALGWVSIDTNIPTGPPVGVCWFDPWWGLVCDSFQPTRTTTELGAALGLGVRWDFSRRVFLDATVGRERIDFDNADRPDFTQLRIAFGIHDGSTRPQGAAARRAPSRSTGMCIATGEPLSAPRATAAPVIGSRRTIARRRPWHSIRSKRKASRSTASCATGAS